MVDAFHASVTARVVGACGEFAHTKEFIDGCRKLRAELESVVGEKGRWASPERDKAVHQYIGGAFCGEFCGGDGEHVGPSAESVGEEEDVGVPSGRGWQGSEIIDTDGYARAVG